MKKLICFIAVVVTVSINCFSVMASEVSEKGKRVDSQSVPEACEDYNEKSASIIQLEDGIYEMIGEDGKHLATIYDVPENEAAVQPRASWDFEWALQGGGKTHGNNVFNLNTSMVIYVDAKFSRTGTSYFGVYCTDNNTYYWSEPAHENGFSFGIRVNFAGNYSIAIKNASSNAITYTGNYWID